METRIKLDRTLVTVNVGTTVHLLLELLAPPATPVRRPPLDVVAVLDRSGSMSGEPLHAVREAACNLLRLLGPADRMGVVAFDDQVNVVLPLAANTYDGGAAALRAITCGGSTNLSGGWLKAFEMLGAGRPDALRRVILLTDGCANVGITDPAQLRSIVGGARAQGVTTSTIGFGAHYDEVFLAAVADAGGGNSTWCAGADQATAVFSAEFDGLASVVAQNISVELRTAPGVAARVLNEYPLTPVPGGLQAALGDAYGGERRRFVARFDLPAYASTTGVDLGTLVVRWAGTVGDVALHETTIPLRVDVTASGDLPAPDPEVTEHVNVLGAAAARKEAHERLRAGDAPAARQAMRVALDRLVAAAAPVAAIDEARADIDRLDADAWTAADSKRLYADARGAGTGRRARYDGSTDDDAT
jgi:Ca-activated chloride channel family protein